MRRGEISLYEGLIIASAVVSLITNLVTIYGFLVR